MKAEDLFVSPQGHNGIRRSLILAGGGMRLAYQAGVLQALQQAGLQFTHVDGTSGGIFNTAMLASSLSPDEMADRWRKLNVKYFMSYRPWKEYLKITALTAVGDADGIRKKVFPALGIDLKKITTNLNIDATFNVCNFSNKSVESIPHTQASEDYLIAGMSLPIFMPAIKINNSWYSDAVWIKDANLMEAVRRGAEELWLVWAIGNNHDYLPGSFNQYVHMIEMSANGGLLEEYAQIKFLNERIAKGDSPYGQKKPIQLFVIKPQFPLPLDPDLFFNKIDTTSLINIGYADAKKYLTNNPVQEIALDAEATKMNSPGIALNFRQQFSGLAKGKNEMPFIRYNLSFTFRNHDGKLSLHHCSSIFLSTLGQEISTSQNQSSVKQRGRVSVIEVASEFEFNARTYLINASLPLGSALDWPLALEFKKINVQIIELKDGIKSSWLKGVLTQSAGNRIRHLFNSSIRNFYGSLKLREKFRMISKLYRYEI